MQSANRYNSYHAYTTIFAYSEICNVFNCVFFILNFTDNVCILYDHDDMGLDLHHGHVHFIH